MTSAPKYNRRTLPAELANIDAWPSFDSTALAPEQVEVWQRRRDAVASYLSGEPLAQIEALYGYQSHQVLLYLNRCVRLMDDGRVAGWIGLVKGVRTGATSRVSPLLSMPHLSHGGYVGALDYTLRNHPAIKLAIDKYLATGVDQTAGIEAG